MTNLPHLSIFTTTRCNLACPLCLAQWLMRARPGYDLPFDELCHFVDRSEALGVYWETIRLTGGEPTLWPPLEDAVERLHASPAFGHLIVNTNGAVIERLRNHRDEIGTVRLSVYSSNVDRVREIWPDRGHYNLSLWNESHRAVPDQPVANSTPSPCICPVNSYFDGRLYRCPVYTVQAKNAHPLDDPEYSCDVDADFLAFALANREARHHADLCRLCISNGIVYRHQPATAEPPVELPAGFDVARGRAAQ